MSKQAFPKPLEVYSVLEDEREKGLKWARMIRNMEGTYHICTEMTR